MSIKSSEVNLRLLGRKEVESEVPGLSDWSDTLRGSKGGGARSEIQMDRWCAERRESFGHRELCCAVVVFEQSTESFVTRDLTFAF